MQAANENPDLSDVLAEVKAAAREEIAAAWDRQVARVRDQLYLPCTPDLLCAVDERLTESEKRLRQSFDDNARQKSKRAAERAKREQTEALNNLARRLRQSGSRAEAIATTADAAARLSGKAACFLLDGETLRSGDLAVPLKSAPAFAGAAESKDTVVAASVASELSATVVAAMEAPADGRVYLVPVVSREKVVAVIYAQAGGEPVDASGLELLASLAAPYLEAPPQPAPNLLTIAPAPVQAAAPPADPLSKLSAEERALHRRARNFARTAVARLVLHPASQVRDARAGKNLYAAFRQEIDTARAEYSRQFIEGCPSMVDYLHAELVSTLARGDAALAGPDYPGALQPGSRANHPG